MKERDSPLKKAMQLKKESIQLYGIRISCKNQDTFFFLPFTYYKKGVIHLGFLSARGEKRLKISPLVKFLKI